MKSFTGTSDLTGSRRDSIRRGHVAREHRADVIYHDVHVSRQFEFLLTLIDGHATIAGDVLELGSSTWAIHGSIPVDGEVILAEFETWAQARAVLATLSSIAETPPPLPGV